MPGGLLGSPTLEVAIGVTLIFLLASLICSAAREAVEGVLRSRAYDLERGLRELLADTDGSRLKAFYEQPTIAALYRGDYPPPSLSSARLLAGAVERWRRNRRLPTYIPADLFASAALNILAPAEEAANAGESPVDRLRRLVAGSSQPSLQSVALQALTTDEPSVAATRRALALWFDGSMDRVSGWYKHRTQVVLFAFGLVLAVAGDVDPITITTRLAVDPGLRSAVVADASRRVQALPSTVETITGLRTEIRDVGYPVGWSGGWPAPQKEALVCRTDAWCWGPVDALAALRLLLGWIATALAVTLGAPFWFDVLNKFMIVRSTVKPSQKSPDEPAQS